MFRQIQCIKYAKISVFTDPYCPYSLIFYAVKITGIPIVLIQSHTLLISFFHYERKGIQKVKRSDIRRVRRFSDVFRFVNDLTALSDGGEFKENGVLKKDILLSFHSKGIF